MSLNVEKIINEVTRVVDGLTGELDGYDLTPKQFDYLLIQASKVEELERQNKRYREAIEKAISILKNVPSESTPKMLAVETLIKSLEGENE